MIESFGLASWLLGFFPAKLGSEPVTTNGAVAEWKETEATWSKP
jgi:hypothetical protein